jgi:hypothetical protein
MSIGDLNGDRKPDLAVITLNYNDGMSVLTNTSSNDNISFAAALYYEADYPVDLAIADLNGDAMPDLIIDGISVLRNKGSSGMISFAEATLVTKGGYGGIVSIADFDADGKPDLATLNYKDTISILKNLMGGGALPVRLVSFVGLNNGDKNILNWKTSTEINSNRYEIERSFDGRIFEKIGTVKSANHPLGSSYNYNDNISHFHINNFYYRLKVVDNDGRYNYSNVVSINIRDRNEKILVLGNLASSYIAILTPTSMLQKPLQAEILDMHGTAVKSVGITNTSFIIYVNQLAVGKYYIRFMQGTKIIQVEQFVKQ